MSLDERLRDELRHAVEANQLREEEAFNDVQSQHRRGLARKGVTRQGVTRQAIAAAVVLSMFAAVAIVVSWRNTPDNSGVAAVAAQSEHRFRSTATIRVAPAAIAGSTSTTISPPLELADPRMLALAPRIRRAALLAAHLSPDDSSVAFVATLNATKDLLSLAATAGSANEAVAVTREWASVFISARRDEAIRALRAASLDRRVAALHEELRRVNNELVRIDPATFKGRDLGFPDRHPLGDPPLPPVPESASVRELNLANERIQILSGLADLSADAARNRINQLNPEPFTALVERTPAVRVDPPSPTTTRVVVGWSVGLVVVLAGAVFAYRRRTRSTRQVSA